ncbi:hypothetical protein N0V94_003585 [Neodidymelliopsis sp. IMI 364377]|nr:hypothetical protein N0V94_003585 [Neodidymelliopsis sp. IMI 364377]
MLLLSSISFLAATANVCLGSPLNVRQFDDKVGYLFVNFPVNDEQVYMHFSDGKNALSYQQLSYDGTLATAKILESNVGTEGVRDHFIVNAQDNSKYWLHATDLKVNALGGDFINATRYGSRSMVIWESTDLATWSGPRLSAPLANASAGNVWAPESYWDASRNEYIVIFSSRFWDPADSDRTGPSPPNQLMYVTTKDFEIFSEAQVYFNPGYPVIDCSLLHAPEQGEDVWYRWVKSEVDYRIWQQRSSSGVLGTWTNVGNAPEGTRITFASQYSNNEGQMAFRDNEDPELIHLWIDQSSTDTYIPAQARTLDDMNAWVLSNTSNFTTNTKHGWVFPLNKQQYNAILAKYKPIQR